MQLVLGIDLGTSYFKLGLFDREGELRGLGRVAVAPDVGDGSRCELPVERFWSHLAEALSQALAQAGAKAADVRALAYSSQANSFVLLDRRDEPLTPLILWTDARATPPDAAVEDLWGRSDFLPATGVGPVAAVVGGRLRRVELRADHQRPRDRAGMPGPPCEGPPAHALHRSRRDDLDPAERLGRVLRHRLLAREVLVSGDLIRQRVLLDVHTISPGLLWALCIGLNRAVQLFRHRSPSLAGAGIEPATSWV